MRRRPGLKLQALPTNMHLDHVPDQQIKAPPPSIFEMTNVLTAGTNTIVTPEHNARHAHCGRMTLPEQTCRLFAPRSCAASIYY